MQLMLLFRGGGEVSEEAERMRKWERWIGGLGNRFVDGGPLREGKVLRHKDANAEDGSFGEGVNEVGGYLIVSAEHTEEAVDLARECPIFEAGGIVEIRQVIEM